MDITPISRRSQPHLIESTFSPHRVSSLCRMWLSQTEPDNLYANAAFCQSPVAVTLHKTDSVHGVLSGPSEKSQDLKGLETGCQSDSYSLTVSPPDLSRTSSFSRSRHELQMQESSYPPYESIVIHLPYGTPKELKTATPASNGYDIARSATVISSSLASTSASFTMTSLKCTKACSKAFDRVQTLMFALGCSHLNFTNPAASRWVDQVIGDERSGITPPNSPVLTRDKLLHSLSVCPPQPDSPLMDTYVTTCRLRGGADSNSQRILNSIQNTPQSAYRHGSGTLHYLKSSNTSRSLSSAGSSNFSGLSNEELDESAISSHEAWQRGPQHNQRYHNIKRRKGKPYKPKVTTLPLGRRRPKTAGSGMNDYNIDYSGASTACYQSTAVECYPSVCVSGHTYLQESACARTLPLEIDHGANTYACSNMAHKHRNRSVFQPRTLPSAKASHELLSKSNLHALTESYLSVLESIIRALDVHLQEYHPSASLRGGWCIHRWCCASSDDDGESPSNNGGPQSNLREPPFANPAPMSPRNRLMHREEKLFKKSYAETDALELHGFTQQQFRKTSGGDNLSSKGLEKKDSSATGTTVDDTPISIPTKSRSFFSSGDDLASKEMWMGRKVSNTADTAVPTNHRHSIFGPFRSSDTECFTSGCSRSPVTTEDPKPFSNLSKVCTLTLQRTHLCEFTQQSL
jgi:hypothetical protein